MTKKLSIYYSAVPKNVFIAHDENNIKEIYLDEKLQNKIGQIQLISICNKYQKMSTNKATIFFNNKQQIIYEYVRNKGESIETKPIYSDLKFKIKKIKRKLITDTTRKVTIYF